MTRWMLRAFAVLVCVLQSEAAIDLGWEDDSDLTNFVTRPEIKAPRFDVLVYEAESVTPGYWFVAPYTELNERPASHKFYQPCQVGPHIYDGSGELVYSGACTTKNQISCDFRAWDFSGTNLLSTILYKSTEDPIGRAVIMDNSYQILHEIRPKPTESAFNMHEFNLVDGGRAAIYITHRAEAVRAADVVPNAPGPGYILNVGFREVDVATGDIRFEWWAYPEIALNESTTAVKHLAGPFPNGWNLFHANSVVKNSQGDYLISTRYTDAVYKISGSTGRVIWRLGGVRSDFQLEGFNFSRQHDAQWKEAECTAEKEVITLLDNAGDEYTRSSDHSSALKIELDLRTMTASLAKRWIRPDQGRSLLRGNFQHLSSSENFFAGWSDNAYLSEHTPSGRLVMEAEFATPRMVTYRAYKQNFTARPSEPPVLKAFVYGPDVDSGVTVSYVSWNGATEVDQWHFYNSTGDLIGRTQRQGFETRLFSKGAESHIYAEAIDASGNVLGRSEKYAIERPLEWGAASLDQEIREPELEGEHVIDERYSATNGVKTEL